jgi:hypothetical protein
MLAQRLGLSINSTRPLGAWSPDDEESLVAWYQKGEGITLNGSDVSTWADSSSNSYDMVQATANEQPAYSAGVLTFDPTTYPQNLQSSSQITLSGQFTVGIKCNPTAFNNVLIGDNTTSNEFFKFTTTSQMRIKIDGTTINITLDSGTWGDDYLVVTRDGSNVLRLWNNGVVQSTTPTLSGTSDIDALGVRFPDLNPYAGTISEVQIYSSYSTALVANVNNRLSKL